MNKHSFGYPVMRGNGLGVGGRSFKEYKAGMGRKSKGKAQAYAGEVLALMQPTATGRSCPCLAPSRGLHARTVLY